MQTESKWIEATHNGGLTYCNSQSNNIIKTWDEIQEEGLKIGMGNSFDYKIIDYKAEKDYYKLQCMAQPYRHNIRLKSFLTAYGRVKIAEVAQTNLDGMLRCHTDGIVFNKPRGLTHRFEKVRRSLALPDLQHEFNGTYNG